MVSRLRSLTASLPRRSGPSALLVHVPGLEDEVDAGEDLAEPQGLFNRSRIHTTVVCTLTSNLKRVGAPGGRSSFLASASTPASRVSSSEMAVLAAATSADRLRHEVLFTSRDVASGDSAPQPRSSRREEEHHVERSDEARQASAQEEVEADRDEGDGCHRQQPPD